MSKLIFSKILGRIFEMVWGWFGDGLGLFSGRFRTDFEKSKKWRSIIENLSIELPQIDLKWPIFDGFLVYFFPIFCYCSSSSSSSSRSVEIWSSRLRWWISTSQRKQQKSLMQARRQKLRKLVQDSASQAYSVYLINHAGILQNLGSNMGQKSVLNQLFNPFRGLRSVGNGFAMHFSSRLSPSMLRTASKWSQNQSFPLNRSGTSKEKHGVRKC